MSEELERRPSEMAERKDLSSAAISAEQKDLPTVAAPAEMPWVTSWRYAVGKIFRPFKPWYWVGTLGFIVMIDQFFGQSQNAILGGIGFLIVMQVVQFIENFLKGPPLMPKPDDEKDLTSLPRTKE